MTEDLARQWLSDVEAADAEAIRGQAAYMTGRLDEYLAARAAESQARLDAIYGGEGTDQPVGADRAPSGDGGSGAGGGS